MLEMQTMEITKDTALVATIGAKRQVNRFVYCMCHEIYFILPIDNNRLNACVVNN